MSVDVTLRWAGAVGADIDTDYKIELNTEEAGIGAAAWSTLAAAQAATSPYTPVTTTITEPLTAEATSVVVASATGLAENDYIVINGEMIKLGALASLTFSGCTRGIGGTIPVAHADNSTVYKAHETYADTARTFPVGRYAMRYRITRVESDGESVPTEILLVDPPPPPFTNMITVWGVVEGLQAQPGVGTVVASIDIPGAFGQDTGEHVSKTSETATVDDDGFWYVFLRRDIVRQGGSYTLTFSPTVGAELAWSVATLPDADSVNFLET